MVQSERVLYLHVRWCCAGEYLTLRIIFEMLTSMDCTDRHHILLHILHLCIFYDGSQRWMEYIHGRVFNGMYNACIMLCIAYHRFQPIVFSVVLTANAFAGMTSTAITIWLMLCIVFGNVVLWCFAVRCRLTLIYPMFILLQAIYSLVPPSYSPTTLYGIDYFVFPSAYFWLTLPLTVILALTPRLIAKTLKITFMPDDIDIIRIIRKQTPDFDLSHAKRGLERLKQPSASTPRSISRSSVDMGRPQDLRLASRTDMATGLVSEDRGFDFASEEGGVAMRRMQSRLSEHQQQRGLDLRPVSASSRKAKEALSHVFSLRRGLLKRSSSVNRTSSD